MHNSRDRTSLRRGADDTARLKAGDEASGILEIPPAPSDSVISDQLLITDY